MLVYESEKRINLTHFQKLKLKYHNNV